MTLFRKPADLSGSGSQEQGKKEFEFQEWGSKEKCRLISKWDLFLPSALEFTKTPTVRQVKSKTQQTLQSLYTGGACRAGTSADKFPPAHPGWYTAMLCHHWSSTKIIESASMIQILKIPLRAVGMEEITKWIIRQMIWGTGSCNRGEEERTGHISSGDSDWQTLLGAQRDWGEHLGKETTGVWRVPRAGSALLTGLSGHYLNLIIINIIWDFLGGQWLRFRASTTECVGLIPDWELRSGMLHNAAKKKKKKTQI